MRDDCLHASFPRLTWCRADNAAHPHANMSKRSCASPKCGALIPPADVRRIDFERIECPVTEALDLTTPIGRAIAGLLAVFAELEHEILRERVRAGLAHARQNGQRLGPPVTAARKQPQVLKMFAKGISKAEIARRLVPSRRVPFGVFAESVNERVEPASEKKRSFLTALVRPTNDQKQVPPDQKVSLELSDRERELILKHTCRRRANGPFAH